MEPLSRMPRGESVAVDTVKDEVSESDPHVVDRDWTTTRAELWTFYLYYVGNSGFSGLNFGPSQFQNLLFQAGYDPSQPPYTAPCGAGGCVLPFLGKVRDGKSTRAFGYIDLFMWARTDGAVNSAALLSNGISFVLQAILLVFIGLPQAIPTFNKCAP